MNVASVRRKGTAKGPAKVRAAVCKGMEAQKGKGQSMDPGGQKLIKNMLQRLQAKKARRASLLQVRKNEHAHI